MVARAGALSRAALLLTVDMLSFPWLFLGGPFVVGLVAVPMLLLAGVLIPAALILLLIHRQRDSGPTTAPASVTPVGGGDPTAAPRH